MASLSLPPEDPEDVEEAEDYEFIEEEICRFWSFVRQNYKIEPYRRLFTYTFRFHHWQNQDTEEMIRLCNLALRHCDKPCKAQLSFSILLLHRVTGERRVFYASASNYTLFPRMQIITNVPKSQNIFLKKFKGQSLEIMLTKMHAPDSHWVLERILGFTLFTTRIWK